MSASGKLTGARRAEHVDAVPARALDEGHFGNTAANVRMWSARSSA